MRRSWPSGSSLIAGLVPAWRASSVSLTDALKEGGRAGGHAVRSRLRNALVVAEVALALTLLVAAGLSVRGMLRIVSQDDGYEQDGVLTMRMTLPDSRYSEPVVRRQFLEALVSKVDALPGVERAGVLNILPSSANNQSRTIEIEGRPARDESERLAAGLPHDIAGHVSRDAHRRSSRDAAWTRPTVPTRHASPSSIG